MANFPRSTTTTTTTTGRTAEILQNFDFTTNLLLLDGFEDFDDAFGVVQHIVALEHLAVLATPDFSCHFIVVLFTADASHETQHTSITTQTPEANEQC
jgi:hypothetical protein